MTVRWLTAFIDRPGATLDRAVAFWCGVTGSSLSSTRGERAQFATLVPPDGDPYLRVQSLLDGAGGCHLDVHVDEVAALADRAVGLGATGVSAEDDVVVLRSPAGLAWCTVRWHGEAVRPAPRPVPPAGGVHLVDQLCIDIPAGRFDEECAFWAALTGWELHRSSLHPEFAFLDRSPGLPLRLLLQRREDDDGPARAHLDLASDDVGGLVDAHVALGASVTAVFERWTALADPSGLPYCVTGRDPRSGVRAT